MVMPRAVLAAVFALSLAARASEDAAIQGLKEGKIVYDITEGDGQKLLGRLETIDETRQEMIKLGVAPRFVLTFRGPATKLVQTDQSKIKPEDLPFAAKIAAKLAQMKTAPGVDALEQCGVAARHQGTKLENVLPSLKVVANSFVTIMGYQAHGYAYIIP